MSDFTFMLEAKNLTSTSSNCDGKNVTETSNKCDKRLLNYDDGESCNKKKYDYTTRQLFRLSGLRFTKVSKSLTDTFPMENNAKRENSDLVNLSSGQFSKYLFYAVTSHG